ncbi:procollagen C-endopeptidase enhancer 1-like [Oculina patagonica]
MVFQGSSMVQFLIVIVLALFAGQGTCDSICPNGFTNITSSSGSIEHYDYGVNETKCWIIEVPDTYSSIGYVFEMFNIEECKSCDCDYLQMSTSYSSLKYASKSCGRYTPNYLKFIDLEGYALEDAAGSHTAYIRFVSDDTVHHKGFNFTYVAGSTSSGDASYLNATEEETIEFGTPKVGIQNYPHSFSHQWFLIVPEGRQVELSFDTFNLEQSEDCKNDYVEVREATFYLNDGTRYIQGVYGPILTGRLCGSSKPSTIQSAGNMIWVQFRSDSNSTTVYDGFKASFKAGQGKLSVSKPMTLLFLSALLMVASKNSLF